jgi:hypothetical protein
MKPINRRLASLAEEMHEIFAAQLSGEEVRDALRALQQRTGASDALMSAANKISYAKFAKEIQEAGRSLEDRKRGFHMVLLRLLELHADLRGGDDDVTIGEVITQEQFERLAASFSLTCGADGEVCDGLQ